MARLRDWIFTVPFLLSFGLILLVFDVVQRVARLFGQRPQEYVAGALQVALVRSFAICGARLHVDCSPRIKPHTPYLIIANHQSMFDVPIFGALFFTNFPKYVSKKSLAKWIPSISYNLRRGGNAIIDRGDPGQAIGAIQELAAQVRERGVSAVIFPEGTRARHGTLGKFRPRGTLALLEAAPDTPVVPVCIDQSWRLLRHNLMPVPFGTRVRVWIGDPIARRKDEDREALLARCEELIRTALGEHRHAAASQAA
ncbi:MAG TPA: lysophospholipid acyltransferase family protein [Candidatus Margulisiibacteriota bacterium]|nr:lysophospholipid acyltransferase family protein [Candidatus Margulisiibacteriota bacterium]